MNIAEEKRAGRKTALRVVNILLTAAIVLLVCFAVLKIFFITWVKVNQTSMYPTYESGETVFVNKLGGASRGEVAVFFDSEVSSPRLASAFGMFSGGAQLLIKRVVATEGDKLWLVNAGDGGYELRIECADTQTVIEEEYFDSDGNRVELSPLRFSHESAGILLGATRWDPYVVGEDCVFMLGDNREESVDSRAFGDVPLSRIVGTAMN